MRNTPPSPPRRSAHAAELRFEEACGHAGHDDESGKAAVVRHARANGVSGIFELCQEIGKKIGVTEDTEVVSAVRVLPEVLGIDDKILAEGLLEPGVEFIAIAGGNGGQRNIPLKLPSGFEHPSPEAKKSAPTTGFAQPTLETTRFSLKGVSRALA